MSHFRSLKHLLKKENISSISKNKEHLDQGKNITNSDYTKKPCSLFFSRKDIKKNLKAFNFFTKFPSNFNMNIKVSNQSQTPRYESANETNKYDDHILNSLLNFNTEYGHGYNSITTQTSANKSKSKKSQNLSVTVHKMKNFNNFPSFDNKKKQIKIKVNNNKLLSHKTFNKNNFYTMQNNRENKICINSNVNKNNKNIIVDNNADLLKAFQRQTINNFNNKYRLKYKTKTPKIHNKISNIFSLLKKYKYEEEKKINTIKTLVNEKPKKIIKNRKRLIEEFNEKIFQKNFTLIEKDFDINNKLKKNKKFVSINTLNLLKNK